YLALPARMRAANLYILPVGVTLAALVALGLELREPDLDPDGQSFVRGMIVLVLMLWPTLAWLLSRARSLQALLLASLVALTCLLNEDRLALQGLAAGALAFGIATLSYQAGLRLLAIAIAALIIL